MIVKADRESKEHKRVYITCVSCYFPKAEKKAQLLSSWQCNDQTPTHLNDEVLLIADLINQEESFRNGCWLHHHSVSTSLPTLQFCWFKQAHNAHESGRKKGGYWKYFGSACYPAIDFQLTTRQCVTAIEHQLTANLIRKEITDVCSIYAVLVRLSFNFLGYTHIYDIMMRNLFVLEYFA